MGIVGSSISTLRSGLTAPSTPSARIRVRSPPMAHVVMQCAQLLTTATAEAVAGALGRLVDEYSAWEAAAGAAAWDDGPPPPPLRAFAERHGFVWPEGARILLKGMAGEELRVVAIDELVFFWGGGFEVGGAGIERFFAAAGAEAQATCCHLKVRAEAPAALAESLARFLDEEDYEEQYSVQPLADADLDRLLHSVTVEGPGPMVLGFDDSGVQDWAFTAVLYQLAGMHPRMR
jgi:hypothetical protein